MKYLFQLGHTPDLSLLELSSLLNATGQKFARTKLGYHHVIVDTKAQLNLNALQERLGGTVKIASFISASDQPNYLFSKIITYLSKLEQTRVSFAINCINDSDLLTGDTLREIKTALKDNHKSARFVETKEVTPIFFRDKNLVELTVVNVDNQYWLFVTETVSDSLSWQKQDRDRPAVDAARGTLPPKVARMLINIGHPDPVTPDSFLWDPMCGSGTIVSQAVRMGFKTYASDIDPLALKATKVNLDLDHHDTLSNKIFLHDATTNLPVDLGTKFDLIVFEGDLGKHHPSDLKTETLRLASLYKKIFISLKTSLKQSGTVVAALPDYGKKSSDLRSYLIDTCEKSGYTLVHAPIVYGHKKAFVHRLLLVLKIEN